MKILLANCRGLSDKQNRAEAFRHIKKVNPDLVLLNETKSKYRDTFALRQLWGQFGDQKTLFLACHTLGARQSGTIILCKNGATSNATIEKQAETGRHIIISATLNGTEILAACFYGDSSVQDLPGYLDMSSLEKDLKMAHAKFPSRPIIL